MALRGSLLLSGGADGKVVAWRLDLAPKRPEVYRLRTLRDPRLVAEARSPLAHTLPCTPPLHAFVMASVDAFPRRRRTRATPR